MSSLVRGNGDKRKEGSGIRKNCSSHLCPIESCKEGYCKAETRILGPSHMAQLGTQPLVVQCLLDLWQFLPRSLCFPPRLNY